MSREYRGRKVVVYPAYLDLSKSRKEGRRVPRSLAVQNPSIDEIATVARELGLNPEILPESKYPRDSTTSGRVVVNKYVSKQKTLQLIARALRERRLKSSNERGVSGS